VVAIAVLAIGLCAMAALVAQSLAGTANAHYMALATTLASEKLEDLNRYPNATPAVAQLTAGGSLTSDATVGGLNYYDDVDLSSTNGEVSETVATSTGYQSIDHYATGVVTPNNNAAAPSGSGNTGFHRRWLIEASPVVGGVTLTGSRRITVLVTLSNQSVSPPVTFQMSTVRP
jgi:Tfp pilus assembly protein PilV